MQSYQAKPEFAQMPEELILIETVPLPHSSLVLSYYMTTNTSRSATSISVAEYGVEIQQSTASSRTVQRSYALCLTPEQEEAEAIVQFLALHTVTPLELHLVLEEFWLDTDTPRVPPAILTWEEQQLLSDGLRRKLPMVSRDLQKLQEREQLLLSDGITFTF